jgi:PIN domain
LKTNFVLIDFENVQPQNVTLLGGGRFKIKVFLGANQAKIPLEMARVLQAFGPDAEYLQIDGHGSNALDFHIAYYIGRLAAENPEAHFHVISKDTGFDPLIKHLAAQGIRCERSKSIADIPLVRTAGSESIEERAQAVASNLAKRGPGKPRTLKTLRSMIRALFAGQITDEDLDAVIEQLAKRGVLRFTDDRVHYAMPV